MIIEFVATNYRSIKEEQVFSMLAGDANGGHEDSCYQSDAVGKLTILKSIAVYGPNASGKSNVLSAIMILRSLVLNSGGNKLDEKIVRYEPYSLDVLSEKQPTKFEIEFLAADLYEPSKNIRYGYVVSYDSSKIIQEELVLYKSAKPTTLYKRESSAPMKWGDYLKGKKQAIESLLLDNQLFLSVAGNTKDHPLSVIYRYFRDRIKGFRPRFFPDRISSGEFTREKMIGDEAEYYTEKIGQLLKAADTGIQNIKIKKFEFDESELDGDLELPDEVMIKFKSAFEKRPHAVHNKYEGDNFVGEEEFEIEQESQGTLQLFRLAGPIIETLRNGAVVIIDEISASLHPSITSYVIGLFNNKETNPNNAQIIFSTHDILTLSSDLLRRDQIWFTQKDKFGATHLYSLLEFGKDVVRKGTNFSSWYLKGKFGALPYVDRNLFTLVGEREEDSSNG